MPRFVTLTSGRHQVGKTSLATGLGRQLAARGQRVCLLDADRGVANAASLLRHAPACELEDLLHGQADASQLLQHSLDGLCLLPARAGSAALAGLDPAQATRMADLLAGLADFDLVLIDAAPTLSQASLALARACPELILVLNPEPASLTDTWALLKQLHAAGYTGRISVVVNRAKNPSIGRHAYHRFREVVEFYLQHSPGLAGLVAEDRVLPRVLKARSGLESRMPDSAAWQDLGQLVRHMLEPAGASAGLDAARFAQRWLALSGFAPPRQGPREPAPQVLPLDNGRRRSGPCRDRWVGELASGYRWVETDDGGFPLFEYQRPEGGLLWFACQDADDAHDRPAPRTTQGG